MSIASEYNAAKDLADALADMADKNPTIRAIASRKAEEAFARLSRLRVERIAAPVLEAAI
jgi:hypothetical protein